MKLRQGVVAMFKLENKEINFLIGKKSIEQEILKPFDENICSLLSDFSSSLLENKDTKKFSDLVYLSFWCRKKHIEKLKNDFKDEKLRIGKGIIFHITPSNVPTNFFYSLVFGLISGNTNIVKVPSKNFKQIMIICKILKTLLLKRKYSKVKKMINIIKYKDSEINKISQNISKMCDGRIIWGGDSTIKKVKEYETKPLSNDLTFADRYSVSLINSSKVARYNKIKMNKLVSDFYNDTMTMDQNACTSPHLVFWIGKEKNKASERFWSIFAQKIKVNYDSPEIASIEKFNQLCIDISTKKNFYKKKIYEDCLYVVKLKKLEKNLENLRGKWGYFYEYDLKNKNNLIPFINRKFQTLTYFGMNKQELISFFSKNKIKGIDRVVPIGQSLMIDLYWDGYDVVRSLSRIINIL